MRLKVNTESGATVISIEDTATISDLLSKLVSDSIIPSTEVKIKSGFPPKLIDTTDTSLPLLDVGIRAGDKLIVENASPNRSTATTVQSEVPSKTQQPVNKPFGTSIHTQLASGNLVLRKIPDDNSCLFRAISYSYFHNLEEGSQLRSIVSDTIKSDPETYNDAILGKPVKEYTDWIQKPNSWGGAIELQILSLHLNVNIYSLEVESGRLDKFGDDSFENFIIVIYGGIHYDTVGYTPLYDLDDQTVDVTVFQKDTELANEVLQGVQTLRKTLNHKGYVTNTSKFKIKCQVCKSILTGEREASEHASTLGHYEFGEV